MIPNPNIYDAIIIGAGPAGLTAGIYLGRFRRRCMIVEDDHSRARWIPTSHNIPGFPAGIGGQQFLNTLKEHAVQYGAPIRRAHVSRIANADGIFSVQTEGQDLCARYVLLATGVRDHLPPIAGAADAVIRGLLRVCPICDAFEAIGKRIAVIGNGALGEREAEFLRTYSKHVTLLQLAPPPSQADRRRSGGIESIQIQLSDLKIREDEVALSAPDGERHFDAVYLALGCQSQTELARSLGAKCDEQGALQVNAHQETSVPRLYAAGDVVRGLNQVVVAAAESAIAAADIHNKLREIDSDTSGRRDGLNHAGFK